MLPICTQHYTKPFIRIASVQEVKLYYELNCVPFTICLLKPQLQDPRTWLYLERWTYGGISVKMGVTGASPSSNTTLKRKLRHRHRGKGLWRLSKQTAVYRKATEKGLREETNLLTPWPQTFSFQTSEKINVLFKPQFGSAVMTALLNYPQVQALGSNTIKKDGPSPQPRSNAMKMKEGLWLLPTSMRDDSSLQKETLRRKEDDQSHLVLVGKEPANMAVQSGRRPEPRPRTQGTSRPLQGEGLSYSICPANKQWT